jgi:hypothetical protein
MRLAGAVEVKHFRCGTTVREAKLARVLDDGTYDAVVVDAEEDGDAVRVELTIVAGAHKGEVVAVRATGLRRDPLDLLALPATVTVAGGRPHVRIG